MSADDIQYTSLAFYNYMCRHIVGSKETVNTKRLLTTIEDNLSYDEHEVRITSGSFGEGLEMKGSDFDFMFVQKYIKVYENISDIEWNASNSYFEINTYDTKLGFVKLQLRHSMDRKVINLCVKDNDNLFLSNILFKQNFSNALRIQGGSRVTEVNHGPCLSDKEGLFDLAYCLHSKSWISQADHWRTRPRESWPNNKVVSSIIDHGVLFVPIGVNGSPNGEVEWRISFSVGEKLLIYSFNHTQLLCYSLMKIVLKDIISTDIRCKDLLCSYYLKNILFWISEETPFSEWKPRYLIHCFMRCFKRLLYCVEYSICPHYFIPENNMFEHKIEGRSRRILLDKLYVLHDLGWRCILSSPQMQDFSSLSLMLHTYQHSFADYFQQMNMSSALLLAATNSAADYNKAVRDIMFYQLTSIKLYHYLHLLYLYQDKAEDIELNQTDTNKALHSKYKTCQSYLVHGARCNPVSGWLKLASFYYRTKQYRKVLVILAYAVSKCSREKLFGKSKLSSLQRQLLVSKILQRKGLVRVLQLLRLESVVFIQNSTLIPQELELEVLTYRHLIPPVVFANFLSFLCHYHLNNVREYRNSIADLQLTISEKYFIENDRADLPASYNVLGVAFLLTGENDSAREAFQYAAALDEFGIWSCARQRLSMMNDM